MKGGLGQEQNPQLGLAVRMGHWKTNAKRQQTERAACSSAFEEGHQGLCFPVQAAGGDGGCSLWPLRVAASPLSSPVPSSAGAWMKCFSASDPFTYSIIIGFKCSCSVLSRAALSPLAVLAQLFQTSF